MKHQPIDAHKEQSLPSETSLIVVQQDTPLADSRDIARQLGVEHESFFTLIKRYQEEIGVDIGLIRFEIGVKMGPQWGKRLLYALLTEDQTYAKKHSPIYLQTHREITRLLQQREEQGQ